MICLRLYGDEGVGLGFAFRWLGFRIFDLNYFYSLWGSGGGVIWISLEGGNGGFLEEVIFALNFFRWGSGEG